MSKPVNLIPAYRVRARHRAVAIARWLQGGIALAVVLGCAVFYFQTLWADDPAALAAERTAAEKRVEDSKARIMRVQNDLMATQRRVEANRAVTNQPNYAVLLALLAQTLDEQVILRSCDFEAMALTRKGKQRAAKTVSSSADPLPPGFEVNATGYAKTQQAVSQYVLGLEQTGLFHEVRLLSTRREPVPFGDGKAIAFAVRCYLATAAPAREASDE